jgi:hypothetical protein
MSQTKKERKMERTAEQEAIYQEGFRDGYLAVLMTGIYALHEKESHSSVEPNTEISHAWTLEEVRQSMEHIEELRSKGLIQPLQRRVAMDWIKKDRHGKYYVASEEQLQEELAMQGRSSIDSNGNLVVDGKITRYGWLQSFDKKDT